MSCDQVASVAIVVTIPSPSVAPELASEVKTAGRYAQIGSALFSSVAGSAVGRMMATRSLAFCDADSAGGGLIDFNFEVCGEQQPVTALDAAATIARSAVLSNIALLGGTSFVMVGLLVVGSCYRKKLSLVNTACPLPAVVASSSLGCRSPIDRSCYHAALWATRIEFVHRHRCRCSWSLGCLSHWCPLLASLLCGTPVHVGKQRSGDACTIHPHRYPRLDLAGGCSPGALQGRGNGKRPLCACPLRIHSISSSSTRGCSS